MTRVALDAMGGDYAPKQIIVGAVEAVCGLNDVSVLLVGNTEEIVGNESLEEVFLDTANANKGEN